MSVEELVGRLEKKNIEIEDHRKILMEEVESVRIDHKRLSDEYLEVLAERNELRREISRYTCCDNGMFFDGHDCKKSNPDLKTISSNEVFTILSIIKCYREALIYIESSSDFASDLWAKETAQEALKKADEIAKGEKT